MDRAVRDAAALIRRYANGNTRDADPVARADARTSMADARTALCFAKGVAIEDIDPASGYEWSAAAYERARDSWRWHVGQHGLSDYTRPWLEEAVAKWLARRPDLADGDDWLAGVAKPEDDSEGT